MCISNVQLGDFGYTKEREERLRRREKESEKEVQLLHWQAMPPKPRDPLPCLVCMLPLRKS